MSETPESVARDRAPSRATPLPEEAAGAPTDGDDRAGAEEILRESEERIAGADDGEHPAEGADQRRRSEETV